MNTKIRSLNEVLAEADALEQVKPRVFPVSKFGDDNHAAVDAQIEVLRKRMCPVSVYRDFGDDTNDEFDQYILDSALYASNWIRGEENNPPSNDWPLMAIAGVTGV